MEECLITIKKYIQDENALYEMLNKNLNESTMQTLRKCLVYTLDTNGDKVANRILEIDSVIDFLHDELNTGHWSEVPIQIRRHFTLASYLKCVILLKNAHECTEKLFRDCLKCLDMGLLLGAPLIENSELLTNSAKYLREKLNDLQTKKKIENDYQEVTAKRKQEDFQENTFHELQGTIVPFVECPSLEYFNKTFFIPQIPVKLKGCMGHWPAVKKWIDVNYLLKIAGDRTVPIEIGSHYVDENWSQKLMTLREFILKHYLSDNGDIGYLAQHNLFEQITELKEDILVPEYCCLSLDYDNCTEPDINAWLGPKSTVSPLHHDPKNNILAQIYGTKQIILFSSKDTPYLYPHEGKMLHNTAQVDPLKPNLKKFPEFLKSTMYKCLLGPGEMLFIPAKWWHHVTALEKSFSVSFWWD